MLDFLLKLLFDFLSGRSVSVKVELPSGHTESPSEPRDMLPDWTALMKDTQDWTEVIWHHSATKDGRTYNWPAIRKYHIHTKGWRDIGYHFGIERVDGILQINIGRPLAWHGAHTIGHNKTAIGICVVGNYDGMEPDEELLRLCVKFAREIQRHYPMMGASSHHYHNEFSPKTCPGQQFTRLEKFRHLICQT